MYPIFIPYKGTATQKDFTCTQINEKELKCITVKEPPICTWFNQCAMYTGIGIIAFVVIIVLFFILMKFILWIIEKLGLI